MPTGYLTGGDISLLTKMEQLGQVYKDRGQARDLLEIFRSKGCNVMRLRLWVQPGGEDIFVNGLAYTITLGRRIKDAGFALLLDFHYSDTWADPGAQTKPTAWQDLAFPDLVRQVEAYSRDVVTAMRQGGASPDIVQIGNEIPDGTLWPDGRISDNPQGFDGLAILLRAGIDGVQAGAGANTPQIMIHIDRGGDWSGAEKFYDALEAHSVPYDLIGLSFYPFYHGPLERLRETLARTARRYRKPINVVETGYPYAGDWEQAGMTYPVTPDGQRQFLADLIDVVKDVPDGLGHGVLYWAPEWLEINGLGSSWDSRTLFDRDGNALPGLDALGHQN